MSKTKDMLGDIRGNNPIDTDRHLDDEYQYEQWCKEMKERYGDPPYVSNCCDAPINHFKDNMICTRCKKFCKPK